MYARTLRGAGRSAATAILALSLSLASMAATNTPAELTGAQIRAAISGKYVTDEHHWGHKYFPDGRVERLENERLKSARWSVKGGELCLLQPEISKTEPICYRVTRTGNELQYMDDAGFVVFRGLVKPMPKRGP
ncbi:TPA: hypothetical protein ONA53_003147 [Pseudomonas aeruginosa]|uniref:hypothetical protein n=1 Tax=Gammaproteobacteria TaxID=1236 RepID=UPI000B0637AF|nr:MULTISPECIES: hypothetical protein [Gammaproteobacteria]HCF3586540.1 hypothetical protein [Pseudomonas aeruginosa]HCR1518711.1 hypothetical protein [Pseudomonas aeruginosa]